MTVQKHTHKLRRHTYRNGTRTYFCILNCDYKIGDKFALGKRTICHRCGNEFSMNSYTITLEKPHCESCHIHRGSDKSKVNKRRRSNDSVLPASVAVSAGVADDVVDNLKDKLAAVLASKTEYRTLVVDESEDEEML